MNEAKVSGWQFGPQYVRLLAGGVKRLAAIALMIFSQVRTFTADADLIISPVAPVLIASGLSTTIIFEVSGGAAIMVTASAIAVREHSNDTGGNLVVTVALVVLAAFLASSGRIAVGPLPALYLSFRAHAYNRTVTPSTACDEKNTAPNREFDVGSGDLGRSPSPDRRYECG